MDKQSKGGRSADFTAVYFSLPSKRNSSWYLISEKFGHLGTAILLANCEFMSSSKHLQGILDSAFYSALRRDHKIEKDQYLQVVNFCIAEVNLYDRFLFERNKLFSLDLLRNFHNAGYFRSRKYKAADILNAINMLRPNQAPLTLEDEFEKLMAINQTHTETESIYDDVFNVKPDDKTDIDGAVEDGLPF